MKPSPPIHLTCGRCDKRFTRKHWEVKPDQDVYYCGKTCSSAARSTQTEHECVCGKTFSVKASRVKKGTRLFCSISCASKKKTTFMPTAAIAATPWAAPKTAAKFNRPPAPASRPVHIGRDRSASSVFTDLGRSGYVRCARCSRERERGARCACERQEMAS